MKVKIERECEHFLTNFDSLVERIYFHYTQNYFLFPYFPQLFCRSYDKFIE